MTVIHPSAIISQKAFIGSNVHIGPYCIIGDHVVLENDIELISHVCIEGRTKIGNNTKVFPFASLGFRPQDLKYKGEPSELLIGSNNIIREYVTMQPGTSGGGMITKIGNDGLFMAGCHVAHDCQVGNSVIMANNATLGGHVEVGDFAVIGGLAAVHQFVRVGHHAIVGGLSGVERDVIPYGSVMGDRAHLMGLNMIGLKRRGYSRDDIDVLRKAYRLLFAKEGTLNERIQDAMSLFSKSTSVMDIINFMQQPSARSFCLPKLLEDLE